VLKIKPRLIAATPFCVPGFELLSAYDCISRAGIRMVEVPAVLPHISIAYGVPTLTPEVMDDRALKMLRDYFASKELEPLTVTTFCDLTDSRHTQPVLRRIKFAQELRARYLIADVSELPSEFALRQKAISQINEIVDYADDLGIRICLEIHEGPTRSGKTALQFLTTVNNPKLGINYDTGNIFYFNGNVDPAEDIQCIASRVTHVHLKDTSGKKGEWEFCTLGTGRVNFKRIFEVLDQAGYEGPYSLEIEGRQGEDLNRTQCVQRIKDSLEYLTTTGLIPSPSSRLI
jgi:L-ribulose-5-phosphate 3-epimerase